MTVTIKGKNVYSDKNIGSVIGTRITYTDGSWCNVETGEVVNKGPGSITIGVPLGKVDKNEIIEKSFMANVLKLTSLLADVNIQVGNHQQIKIKVEGSDSAVKDIDISENENILCIKGKDGIGSRRINIQMKGGGSSSIFSIGKQTTGMNIIRRGGVCISSGNVIISEGNNISIGSGKEIEESETKITVSVPKGTQIDVSDISGQVNIGDTEGRLQASVRSNNIYAGLVKDAVLSVNGSGEIRVQEVIGSLTAQIAGSGDIRIRQGDVTMLNATVVGSGDIIFGGRAKDAILTITGSGDIKVAYVKNRPITNIVGSGDIDIGN